MRMKNVRSSHKRGYILFASVMQQRDASRLPQRSFMLRFRPRDNSPFATALYAKGSTLYFDIIIPYSTEECKHNLHKEKNYDSKRDFPHQSGISSPNLIVVLVSRSVRISISELFLSNCIIYSRQAPQGDPTLPSHKTASTLSI